MGFWDFFKKKEEVDLEAKRREYLNRFGRITEGTIIDSESTDAGEIVYFCYSVQGADYESSEILPDKELSSLIKYAPGSQIGVRYDPRQHANSILV